MKIRARVTLVVLPVLIVGMAFTGGAGYFVARGAVSRVTQELLSFKVFELEKYAESQWRLLVENGFTGRQEMVEAAKSGVAAFAESIIRTDTEAIIAFDQEGQIASGTKPIDLLPREAEPLQQLAQAGGRDFITISIGGIDRVARGFPFPAFGWYILVTEEREAFFSDVNDIRIYTGVILLAAAALSVVLLLLFARRLTDPLTRVVQTMETIMTEDDLSSRVPVEYNDETGTLAHTFNIMVGELDKSYGQIKRYAFSAVLSQKRETKIRNIFQKYVPPDVIDTFFDHPDRMLEGNNRKVSILFSDIRSFTTISETFRPNELVETLNRYFQVMVNIIDSRNGIVDKYIGDAIMGIFGHMQERKDDVRQSVLAGIEMTEGLEEFNAQLTSTGKKPWKIGVGINYGEVTVGNIGTDKKLDYTVIGDEVNLGSRMEGLTKEYQTPLLITQSAQNLITDELPCRLIDVVQVKGKTEGTRIYTARKELNPDEARGWPIHEEGMALYFNRDFAGAKARFQEVSQIIPDDFPSQMMAGRCTELQDAPPPEDWDFTVEMTHK